MYSENENFNEEYENIERESTGNKFKDFYESNKKMVLILAGFLLVLIILLMVNSCKNNDIGENSKETIKIVVTPNEKYLNVDNSFKLVATVEPSNIYGNPRIEWKSSDDKVASVDGLGNVTALKLGNAIVTATFRDDKNNVYTEIAKIFVIEGNKDIVATDVKFPEGEILITRGDKYKLPKEVTPGNGFIEKIVYESSDSSIVTVDETGNIKPLRDGVATIKVSVNDGKFTDEIKVNIVSDSVEPQIIINPISIGFNDREITIVEKNTKKLTYQYLPSEAYVDDLEWSSSDEQVASVSNDGIVTANSSGVAIITVKTRTGITDTISVRVEKGIVKVTSLKIESSRNLTMKINDTASIVANVLPNDATDKSVKYESTNSSVVRVDNNGIIRAISSGSTVIIITTNDGDYKDYVSVTVNTSSSSDNSSGGSSGESSSSCTANSLIRISSDSGDNIVANSPNSSKVATKTVINIETDLIGTTSSCKAIKTIKWCYNAGSECSPNTEFKVGDKLVMNVPSGEGRMYLTFEATLENGSVYSKNYYMNYKNDGSSSNTGSQQGSTGSFSVSVSMTKVNQYVTDLIFNNLRRFPVTFSSNEKIKNIYFCDTGPDKSSCSVSTSSNNNAMFTGNEYVTNKQYNTTFVIKDVDSTRFENYFRTEKNSRFCFVAVDYNGNKSSTSCKLFD